MNNKRDIAASVERLGRVAEIMRDREKARALYTESLGLWQTMGHRPGIAGSLEGMARLGILYGEPERAARLFGAAAALREAAGAPLSPRERKEVQPGLTAVRAALSDAAFETAWAKGQAMSLEQTIDDALEGGGHQCTDPGSQCPSPF